MMLDDLEKVINERKKELPEGSYVASLIKKGKDTILQKIGEEAIEVIIASKAQDRGQVIKEMADLWFHCMVLLTEEGIRCNDVFNELEKRKKT